MDALEISKVELYLKKLGNPRIQVKPRPKREDSAEVFVGDEPVGVLLLDDEDDDRSYQFQLSTPDADLANVGSFLKTLFGNPKIAIRARPKKQDSAEVYVDEEFLGVLFLEDDRKSYQLQMTILDIDLE